MEPRGRRGAREPGETAASEGRPTPLSAAPEPDVAPSSAAGPEAADPGERTGDSPSVPTPAEAVPARAPASLPESLLRSPGEPAALAAAVEERDCLIALARSQAALARGLVALGGEMAGLACSGFAAAARLSELGVRIAAGAALPPFTPPDRSRAQALRRTG